MRRLALLLATTAMLASWPAARAAAAPYKYSLSLFHFNIEYSIGGLYGFIPLSGDWSWWNVGPDEVEDAIVTQGLQPLLDLLEKHPDWTFTVEMQAYAVEVMAARHPDVLQELQTLAAHGQVELVSFHYADQFLIAYPYVDWKASVARTKKVFADNGLPLSAVAFAQEGQAGEGLAAQMLGEGYSILVAPANLWIYQHGAFDAAPFYALGDALLVAGGQSVTDEVDGVYVVWSYFGDGDTMATGGVPPYYPWAYYKSAGAVDKFENAVLALVEQGCKVSSIAGYVSDMQAAGLAPSPPPSMLDGTWQPDQTDGNAAWLGGLGFWKKAERDNNVLTLAYMARQEILAAQSIAAAAGIDAAAELAEAARQLNHGEVSEGTGVNPYAGEVEFCLASSAEALRKARAVVDQAKAALAMGDVLIDTATGAVTAGEFSRPGVPVDNGPFDVTVQAAGRATKMQWYKVAAGPAQWRLEIGFSAPLPNQGRAISVMFPGVGDEIQTTAALVDDNVRTYLRTDFAFDHWYLPAPIGLVGLGANGWVVADAATVHVAARIEKANGNVTFVDDTAPTAEEAAWIFHVTQGTAAEALALADSVNVHPTLAR